jgi:4-aminobutyrate aminotransferase-like enzyme/Ser/Thr protein kinase RdoA (MazF antagonist)
MDRDGRQRPETVDVSAVGALVGDHYGLTGSLTQLVTEQDDSYRLSTKHGDYLVKVSGPHETVEHVDLQVCVLEHLAAKAPELPVPRVVRTRDGSRYATLMFGERSPRTLRLMDFVPGRPLSDVPAASPDLLAAIGSLHARLTDALRGFFHPAQDRRLVWDMQHLDSCLPPVELLGNDEQRRLAEAVVRRFDRCVRPQVSVLPRQVVHGDLSPYNVIIDEGALTVAGLIDFGDVVRTALLFDLTVPLANLIDAGGADPWSAADCYLKGFLDTRPISDRWVRILTATVPARLLLRAMIAEERTRCSPERGAYLAEHARRDWQSIEAVLSSSWGSPSRGAGRAKDTEPRMTAPPPPTMVNGFDPESAYRLRPALREKIERRTRVLGPGYRLFYDEPLEVVSGHGAHIVDADGTDYLDAYNNVPSVGHCHPYVVEAVHRQMATLNTNTRYVQDSVIAYAERLLATFPAELDRVTFTCSGSEANDLAARVAIAATGNTGFIVTANAYHGVTAQVASFSPSLGPTSPIGSNVRVIPAPDSLRLRGADLAAHLRQCIAVAAADLAGHGYGLAALFADTIFSSDGVYAAPPGFLQPVVDEVHAAGGVFVADEVQPGFGRTGESWWGFQRHGVVPDMATLGKPMGNGVPIAAVVFRHEVAESFGRRTRYFNTFGGSSVPIAAAMAVLDVIEAEDLIANAHKQGVRLRDGLQQITRNHDRVAEVRGAGLFIGVDLVVDRDSLRPDGALGLAMVNELRQRRVLVSVSATVGNVVKIRPPMVFSDDDCSRLLTGFADSLQAVCRGRAARRE